MPVRAPVLRLLGGVAVAALLTLPAQGQQRAGPLPPLSAAEASLAFAPVGREAAAARDVSTGPAGRAAQGAAPVVQAGLDPDTLPRVDAPALPLEAPSAPMSADPAMLPRASQPQAVPAVAAPAPGASPDAGAGIAATTPTSREAVVQALAAHLQDGAAPAGSTRAGLQAFYQLRGQVPVWIDAGGLTGPGRALVARLAQADADGLDPRAYAVAALDHLAGPSTDARLWSEAELGLSSALIAYANDAAQGRIDPRRIGRDIVADNHRPPAASVLTELAIAADPAAVLDGYNPTHPGFLALKAKLAELRHGDQAVAETPHVRIPTGRVLRPGMQDTRVAALRERLGVEGTLSDADSYDEGLVQAVRAFQRERNLKVNGVLNLQTLAALNGTAPSARSAENQIVANMERWRWLPRDLGARHILVNVPEFHLWLTRDGAVEHEAKVVVGKPTNPTPIFSDRIQFLVLNPSWNVPQSIIEKEYLPKLAQDPDYLIRHGYDVTMVNGHLQVRQPPGEDNALGHIKFMFPNNFSVYLHDTSQRQLFSAATRAFSHGCVRVDDPDTLAEMVLGPGSGWTADRIQSLVGGKERRINVPKPVPVHIAYFTARVDEQGELKMIDDVYGYNRKVMAALDLAS